MKRDLRDFLNSIENESKNNDCKLLIEIMEQESGYKASLHGKIIGFGTYHYQYQSGRQGDSIVVGFSPRAQSITIYIMPGFSHYEKELEALGKHKSSKSCLYISKLSDINEKYLRKIIRHSVQEMQKKYECKGP
jgi:hypothetical protein